MWKVSDTNSRASPVLIMHLIDGALLTSDLDGTKILACLSSFVAPLKTKLTLFSIFVVKSVPRISTASFARLNIAVISHVAPF